MLLDTSINSDVVIAIRNALIDGDEKLSHEFSTRRNTDTRFFGSEFNYCIRRIYYRITGEKSTNYRDTAFLNDGFVHEAVILKSLDLGSIPLIREFNLEYNYGRIPLQGTPDGITTINGERVIIECKALQQKRFKELKDNPTITEDWYGQVQAYMMIADAQITVFIIKARETAEIIVGTIERDDRYIAEQNEKHQALAERYLPNREVPARPVENKSDPLCKWCPYKELCWNRKD